MPKATTHKQITAARYSGQAGVQIRKLLLDNLPGTTEQLTVKLNLPRSTVHYYLIELLGAGKVTRVKVKQRFTYSKYM